MIAELSQDDSVRCLVLRGAGDKSFAPGNDIAEFATERSNIEQARAYGAIHHATLQALYDCRHPMVAMIKGICVGGGLEIAALCDLRICGASSRFGIPINRLGLVLGPGELQALHRLVGRATALEVLLEGRVFDGAPLVARWHKQFLRRLEESRSLTQAELDEGYACYGTEDFTIEYQSFLNKTQPKFRRR